MEIKVNVGSPKDRKTFTFTISEEDARAVHGKKLGDTIRGELIGKPGYELLITGGSDRAGFPMRDDVQGSRRQRILVTRGTGNRKTERGQRIRKTVAGNTVGQETRQLNVKVTTYGKAPLADAPEEKGGEDESAGKSGDEKPDKKPEEDKKEDSKDESEDKKSDDKKDAGKDESTGKSGKSEEKDTKEDKTSDKKDESKDEKSDEKDADDKKSKDESEKKDSGKKD